MTEDPAPATPFQQSVAEIGYAMAFAKRSGHLLTILRAAREAMAQLAHLAEPAEVPQEDRVLALQSAKRIGYNAAADAWPGWDFPPPARTDEELRAALELAVRTAQVTARLPPDPLSQGNAAWLLGAMRMALGEGEAAVAAFADAIRLFGDLSEMKLMAQGYLAIAQARFGLPAEAGAPDFDAVIAALVALNAEDSAFFCGQLRTARSVFPEKGPDGL